MIRDPKYRIIMSENIKDKIVNLLISKYILIPTLEPKLIDTNVATRINKGSEYAFNKLTSYINKIKYNKKEIYILKIDISKYFYNIDHIILKQKLQKYIKDKDILNIINDIISSTNKEYINKRIKSLKKFYISRIIKSNINEKEKIKKIKEIESIPLYNKNKGLPIGNMTSQILAVFYLNNIDHYIKENLKHKYYIRYMDDLIILDNDKNKLRISFKLIEQELNKLNLNINNKSNIYRLSNGINFLGYIFKIKNKNKLIVRYKNTTIRRIIKRLKRLKLESFNKYTNSYKSYKGYFNKSNTELKKELLGK